MTDRQALLSAAGKQRPYKAVNIKPPAMPGDIYFYLFCKKLLTSHLVYCIIIQVAERYGTGKRPEALIGKGLQEPKELEKRKKKLLDKLRSMR